VFAPNTPLDDRDDPSEPEDLVCVARYDSLREAGEHGLVVLAMGSSYWLEESPLGYGVLVEEGRADAVREEFDLFDQANANWPPPETKLVAGRVAIPWFTPLLWAAAVIWVFRVQLLHWNEFVTQGALDARALFVDGEWWRPFSALFLHADVGHLTGNVVIGVFVFANVVAAVGVLRAWSDLLLASVAANVATAAVHFGTGTRSLGASTAIFAGLGWLTGRAVRTALQKGARPRSRAVVVPLATGFVLLGWLGGGGDLRTDVIAHAAGFAAGVLCGVWRRVVEPHQS